MRGTVAKRLRREVFGDMSFRQPRRYFRDIKGTLRVSGLHGQYRERKQEHRRGVQP